MEYIKPQKLKKGDKIGVVSPSNSIQGREEDFEKAKKRFKEVLGIELVAGKHAFDEYFYSAGRPEDRAADLNALFADPQIKAIFFSTGGNTCIDLVERIDYDLIRKNPKIVSGISDGTTLLNSITAKTGLVTFLGMEFFEFANREMNYEFEYMKKAWFDGSVGEVKPNPDWTNFDQLPTRYGGWRTIRPGITEGRLVGGNFTCFAQLFGTPYMTELPGNIMVVETYQQHKKQIHRSMMQLRISGVFKNISGLVIGYCTGSDDPGKKGNDRDIKDILLEVTEGYDFPIMEVGEIGHYVENIIIPIGGQARLNAEEKKIEILEVAE
jgi:muramoyltetrapeptide carboxypeptidase